MELEKIQKWGLITFTIAIPTFFVGTILAIILYPDYNVFTQFMSDTGMRVSLELDGETYQPAKYPEIFNVTLVITGLLWIPFFPIAYTLISEQDRSKYLFMVTTVTGTLSGPFLIAVGIYDVGMYFDEHVFAARNLYLTILVTSVFWAVAITSLDDDAEYKTFKWKLDVVVSLIIVFLMAVNYFNSAPPIFPLNKIPIPTYQKTVAYTYIGYFAVVVRRMWKIFNKSTGN